jgi:hypothetical protein
LPHGRPPAEVVVVPSITVTCPGLFPKLEPTMVSVGNGKLLATPVRAALLLTEVTVYAHAVPLMRLGATAGAV